MYLSTSKAALLKAAQKHADIADIIINEFKDQTSWFDLDGMNDLDGMYTMLTDRMKFGTAEATVIMAALIRCGTKFSTVAQD